MSDEAVTRKLTAILYADVAEYSRLTGEDEVGTHKQLSAGLDLISTRIESMGGHVVHYAGDAVLAEFQSVVAAVETAVEIQQSLASNGTAIEENRRLKFRIGVNLGEVILDRDDIYGDGVNIAARLEGLAEPGGICISRKVLDEVRAKLDVGFEFLGDQSVKNIATPIPAYKVLIDREFSGRVIGENTVQSPPRKIASNAFFAAIVLAVVVGAAILWRQPGQSPVPPGPVSTENAPPELPDIPSIAVLPFTNMSDDREQEYFSDGMTEDLITDLSKVEGLFVVARNSTFTYKGKSTDIRQVGIELGVRYVLEGSVRKVGGQVRINAQLIDAATGGHIWADRYDGDLKNVFALQDKITAEIVLAMTTALGSADAIATAAGATGKTTSTAAYDEYLQGWSFYIKRTPQDFVAAVSHFERALELDPDYSLAHAALASVYWESWKRFWQRHLGLSGNYPAWEAADRHLEIAFKSPSPLAHRIRSEMLFINRRFDKAIAEAEKATKLNPNDALGYVVLAEAKTFAGLARQAVPLMEKAMRLDPHSPPSYLYSMGLVQFGLANYGEAARFLERAIGKNAQDPLWYVLLIATYGHLNELEKAKDAGARLVDLQLAAGLQRFTIGWPHGRWPFKDKKDRERLKQGLLAGGLPEY